MEHQNSVDKFYLYVFISMIKVSLGYYLFYPVELRAADQQYTVLRLHLYTRWVLLGVTAVSQKNCVVFPLQTIFHWQTISRRMVCLLFPVLQNLPCYESF